MSALEVHRKAWQNAEAKAAKQRRKAAMHHKMMIAESKAEARECGRLADHYKKSKVLTKIESASEAVAEAIDETVAVAKEVAARPIARKVAEIVKAKAKAKVPEPGFREPVVTIRRVERVQKVRKKRGFWGWLGRCVRWVFRHFVEWMVWIDGAVQIFRSAKKAATAAAFALAA